MSAYDTREPRQDEDAAEEQQRRNQRADHDGQGLRTECEQRGLERRQHALERLHGRRG